MCLPRRRHDGGDDSIVVSAARVAAAAGSARDASVSAQKEQKVRSDVFRCAARRNEHGSRHLCQNRAVPKDAPSNAPSGYAAVSDVRGGGRAKQFSEKGSRRRPFRFIKLSFERSVAVRQGRSAGLATFIKIALCRKMRRRTRNLVLPPFRMCEALGARNNSAAKGHAKRPNNGYFSAPHLRENSGPIFRLYELKIGCISGWQNTRRTFFSVPSAPQRDVSDL